MIKQKEIEKITNRIIEDYKPEKIYLFGSFVWGKPTKDSDLDLFIIKNSKKIRRERQIELRTRLFPSGLPLDILVYTPKEVEKRLKAEDFFIRDIINKGKVLYDSSK